MTQQAALLPGMQVIIWWSLLEQLRDILQNPSVAESPSESRRKSPTPPCTTAILDVLIYNQQEGVGIFI